MPIDRCVCKDITLDEMKTITAELRAQGLSDELLLLDQVEQRVGCGSMCGLCRPYIKLMIRTGQTQFAVLTVEEWDVLSQEDQSV